MNLRTATIWTTGLALIATIIAPYIVAPHVYGMSPYFDFHFQGAKYSVAGMVLVAVFRCSLIWLFSGSPLAVSLLIAKKLKNVVVPHVVLNVSTIAFCLWAAYSWCVAIFGGSCMAGMSVIYIVPGSLLFMIPAWFIAWKTSSRFVKKEETTTCPGTTASTPSSPAPLK